MSINTGPAVGYTYANIASQATFQLRTGAGILHSIVINGGTTGAVINVYDAVGSDTSPIIATITLDSAAPRTLLFDAHFTVGLKIVTATQNPNITVNFV